MLKHKSLIPLIVAGVMLAACAAPAAPAPQAPQQPAAEPTPAAPAAPAQPAGDEPKVAGVDRRFDGVTLRAAFIGGGQYEKMYESIKDWEAATGAKVDIVYKGDGFEIDKKLKTDFAAGTGDYDVVWNHTSFFSQYIPFLEPLENYFTQEELKDFSQAILKSATRDGHLWLIPRHADISVVHYRTDLYNNEQYKAEFKAKYGYDLAPPETWKQFFDHAEFFTGKEPGLLGTNFAGKEEALSGRFYEILVANGGKMLDENFKPAFNSEAGVKTAQFFRELYARKLVPADMTSLLWDGVANNFCQGNIAVHNEWFGWYSYFQDPKNCKVAGKFDLIRQPVGEGGIRSGWAGAHAFSIPASSKNKEAAAALIKFLTSEKIMYEEAKLGFLPVRDSVWARIIADAAKSDNPLDKKRLEIAQTAIANDFFAPPLIAEWIPLTNILTPKLQAIMLGDIDAKQGLDEAAAEVEKMLAEAGYYNK
ncbi:MAG: ABC transporter substrate-binding protein [Candidatus Brachytrichaceae bacterium NZ_4S206]|jgi:multiple sugar transport system substrate-binding protein